MKQQSILFFCGDGNSLVNFRGNLIKQFIKKNFKVYAIAPNLNSSSRNFLTNLGVHIEIINFERKSVNPFSSFISLFWLTKKIKNINADITFSYTHKPLVFGAFASYFSRIPKIVSLVTGTGHIFDNQTIYTKLRRFVGLIGFKLALKISTHIIFQNKDDKSLFIDLKLAEESKTSVVNGSGVDIDYFSPEIHPSQLTFLCLARLIKSKGLEEYAHACKIVREKIPNARFLLGGAPDIHSDSIDLEEIQNSWFEKYGIEYIGFIDDPREAIEMSSVYVLLSYNEGTPRTVLEAMSMGRPIITTDVNGCRETVKDGVNGFLVPKLDFIDAAHHMVKFSNSLLLSEMGRESRQYCEEKYDVHKVNTSIFNILGC